MGAVAVGVVGGGDPAGALAEDVAAGAAGGGTPACKGGIVAVLDGDACA